MMKKLFFDFFPLAIFFVVFKLSNIYMATAALMVASTIQIGYEYIRYKKVEAMHIVTLVLVIVFGGLTIYFHNDRFIQWKVSILNWLFAAVFLASQLFMKKPIIRLLMEKSVALPEKVWNRLSSVWVCYFILLGCLNIYVAYNFSLNAWVNFKLFGLMGCTIIFVVAQSAYLYKHIDKQQ
jgi:intracellular septation protein